MQKACLLGIDRQLAGPIGRENVFRVVVTDTSGQKEAETIMHITNQFLQATLDALTPHIAILNQDGVIEAVNEAWRRFARDNGAPGDCLCEGADYLASCHSATGPDAEMARKFAAGIRDVLSGRVKQFVGVYPCHSPDEERWFEGRVTRFPDDVRRGVVVAHENITERKRAELALDDYQRLLRSLASKLAQVEDRERQRTAVYLHDRVGQALAAVRVKFSAWKKMASSPLRDTLLLEIEQLIDDTIDETRTLTFELSPPILHELGLGPALEWLGETMCGAGGIEFTFRDQGIPSRLREELASTMYRIARELLTNVLKHAGARSLLIALSADTDYIRLEVTDDGSGVDLSRCRQALNGVCGSFGLFSIHTRLQDIGGTIEIASSPETGTCVQVAVPLVDGVYPSGLELP